MRGTERARRTGSIGRRLGQWAGLGGAASVVAVIGLALTATAFPLGSTFPGAVGTPYNYYGSSGCAQTHAPRPTWSAKTGDGALRGSTVARTCPAVRGGTGIASGADVTQEISVSAPVTLPTGAGGINVTWSLRIFGNQSATFSRATPDCPAITVTYNYGYTTYSYTYWDCIVSASVQVGIVAWLSDVTNGSTFVPSNSWAGLSSSTAIENVTNFSTSSNSSYWGIPNGTTFNGTIGGPAKISGRYDPTLFINGTFVHSHRYLLETYVFATQATEIYGYPSGRGFAHTLIDMGGKGGHADLMPFSIW